MKLKNKKTGEIVERIDLVIREEGVVFNADEQYTSLAELNEEWEDYEEPKKYWFIGEDGRAHLMPSGHDSLFIKRAQEIGNYFETEDEAEKAVEKLKAWKRLKGGGFEFMSCSYGHDKIIDDTGGWIRFRVNHLYDERYGCEVEKDLDLLFSGEDD